MPELPPVKASPNTPDRIKKDSYFAGVGYAIGLYFFGTIVAFFAGAVTMGLKAVGGIVVMIIGLVYTFWYPAKLIKEGRQKTAAGFIIAAAIPFILLLLMFGSCLPMLWR